ncbi:MAG: thiopurine S-methyltransferase [Gammaproteobacteria bacterium]|nr:thiopurine S-methyltransferase [Gammaproteobacteria bacterium]
MDVGFWKQRWKDRQTGFHLAAVNPYLISCWDFLSINQQATVFVPLCGKSLDIIWLASLGLNVIGVECSKIAIQAFFDENQLNYQQAKYNNFTAYTSDNIRLLQGDYFSLVSEVIQEVSVVYDRASLVAMPVDMRKRYVDKQNEILPESVKILLVTLEYDQLLMNGPPFSVSQNEVMNLYQDRYNVKQLLSNNILDAEPRFKQRGLDYLNESVYLLEPK